MHTLTIALAGLSYLLISASASCLHNTPLMPRQTTGNGVAVAQFGYTGLQGPAHWHKLNPNNSKCATGDLQSPIDVLPAKLTYLQSAAAPQLSYPPIKSATFENLGSTVEVLMTSGSLAYNGTTYTLKQFHFHTPSEHRIAGEAFPLEMHLVHVSPDNAIAVVGQLFELSAHSSTALLDEVFAHIAAITTPGSVTKTGRFNLNKVADNVAKNGVYTYGGSLTTPPCSEGVTWFVAKETLPIDLEAYEEMKHVVKFNSRFTQGDLGAPNVLSPMEVV
ncbi:MAG: hypothetical protein Q9195_007583 [Heterodermia aff. obscurata]